MRRDAMGGLLDRRIRVEQGGEARAERGGSAEQTEAGICGNRYAPPAGQKTHAWSLHWCHDYDATPPQSTLGWFTAAEYTNHQTPASLGALYYAWAPRPSLLPAPNHMGQFRPMILSHHWM